MPIVTGNGGSSSFVPARNVGQAEFDYDGLGQVGEPTTPVALTYSLGDTGLVDLTTPDAPKIITPGIYAFTVVCAPTDPSDVMTLRLLLDDNYYSIPAHSGLALSDGRNGLCAVWFCDAADPFALYIAASSGGVPVNVAAQLFLQRLA